MYIHSVASDVNILYIHVYICIHMYVYIISRLVFWCFQDETLETTRPKKKQSRKQRRKTRNLCEEYTRGQRKQVWLETHIWHAKRMHMQDYHGYRVAERSNDKGIRQAYLSMQYGCLLSVSGVCLSMSIVCSRCANVELALRIAL